jgi:hypothetical protein
VTRVKASGVHRGRPEERSHQIMRLKPHPDTTDMHPKA